MMAFKGSVIFVINIVFGLCIDSLWTLNVMRPVRGSIARRIPIRPLDRTTMHRLALRRNELNPDAEPVYLPSHLTNHRPLQIMERISVPIDGNTNWNRRNKDNFNVLNFDAYVMKPTNGLSPNPVTERVFRLVNQTEHFRGDAKPSPSQYKYRSKSVLKKPKKPAYGMHVKEYDDLEFYRAYLEHQKHAAMVKRLKPRPEPSSRLPIGIEFFEQKKKQKMAFPPITYAPLYLNNLHRAHHDDVHRENVHHENVHRENVYRENVHRENVHHEIPPQEHVHEASNVQHVKLLHPDVMHYDEMPIEPMTTPMALPSTTMALPIETEMQAQTQIQTQTLQPQSEQILIDAESIHSLASKPEMYKFTIDDVVVKPQSLGMVSFPFNGPVTLPPPLLKYKNPPNTHLVRSNQMLPMSSPNTIHENRFDMQNMHYQTQINYPPSSHINPRIKYRRPERVPYKNGPIEGASSHQQIQKFSIAPITPNAPIAPIVMTTQMAFAIEKENNGTAPTKTAASEVDSKHFERRNKRRRTNTERPEQMDRQKADPRKFNQQNDYPNNLEFSSSYTKRRTQGYNSEEDAPTTPISPAKLKEIKDEIKPTENITTNTPKTEKIKYFQDTLTEQITPHQIDFGHLAENPAGWEERYERKNLKSQRHQGRVKWGDRRGNFGEHVYDLNHHRNMKQSNHTRSSS